MLIKSPDSKATALATLEQLKQLPKLNETQKAAIDKELRIMRAGIKGEEESAYLIDFDFKDHRNIIVVHDLRFEVNGRIAQIDHLILTRVLEVFVLETKHFQAGIKINENGEFLRWNHFKKTYEGMPSPLEQNERHISVLADVFKAIDMPTRLGIRLKPSFISHVLISPSARIDRPKKFDTSAIIKADQLKNAIFKSFDDANGLKALGAAARLVSIETLTNIANQLCALHRPIQIDYNAKFGISNAPSVNIPQVSTLSKPVCRHCNSAQLSVAYGKYGYYFKCIECEGNTALKVLCVKESCKARIRKDNQQFYRECTTCNSSSLYFTNPVEQLT